jgi:hypothetical protein
MKKIAFSKPLLVLATLIASAGASAAGYITLPSGSVSVPSTSAAGTTVTLSGTYDPSDTVIFTVSGEVFLQDPASPRYGTNAAGVVITPGAGAGEGGDSAVMFGSYVNDTFGALLVSLNGGAFKQIFTPDAATGLGAASPPTTLTFGGLASALFGSFGTVTNPSITFVVADDLYSDNTGSFKVSSSIPEPSIWAMMLVGFAGLGFASYRASKKISAAAA